MNLGFLAATCLAAVVGMSSGCLLRPTSPVRGRPPMSRLAAAALALSMLSPALAADADLQISRAGTRTANAAPAQNFTGSVTVEMLHTPAGPERASAGSVSFSPGARTAWHTHPLGQSLVVTAGVGRVQR